ncbi:MAG TPA: hypothetical protein ENG63_03500 [Candidatus Desulfofervidus auxilii]|uniref:C2H2-type domain-containing protein n=1 Tax=Desulfofervidus auxilii TaxID=1621989 RepID=A0A7C0Y8V5_DESA2|nr:hypothetical protein [Candidatus Desulfofervidus auxilii]
MVTITITKDIYISPILSVRACVYVEAENKKEAERIIKERLEQKEKEIIKEIKEMQRKCKHRNIVEHRHLDGSIGIYCADCGKYLCSRNTLFGDDFLKFNPANFGRKFRCRKCGKEFIWGENDQDFCEHLDGKQPYLWVALNLIEFL